MTQTIYDRVKTMTKDELTIFLRNIYLMGVLDERRGAHNSLDYYYNMPAHDAEDATYTITMHEVFELYSIIHESPFGSIETFGVFKSWNDAFQHISKHSYHTLSRTGENIFCDGYDTYEIIKL